MLLWCFSAPGSSTYLALPNINNENKRRIKHGLSKACSKYS